MRRLLLPGMLLLALAGLAEAGSCDVSIVRIIYPRAFEDSGSILTPLLRVANAGPDTAFFRSWVRMTNPDSNEVYRESLDVVSLGPGASMNVEFPECIVVLRRGYWLAVCSLHAPGDIQPENDTLSKSFMVSTGLI